MNILISGQANSVASIGKLYSDLDSGDDEESHDSRNMIDNATHVSDEVDESKFFAGVFTTQRSEEDLVGYVKNYFLKRVDSDINIFLFFYQIPYVLQGIGQFAIAITYRRVIER